MFFYHNKIGKNVHKENFKIMMKKTNKSIEKWAKDMKGNFTRKKYKCPLILNLTNKRKI